MVFIYVLYTGYSLPACVHFFLCDTLHTNTIEKCIEKLLAHKAEFYVQHKERVRSYFEL